MSSSFTRRTDGQCAALLLLAGDWDGLGHRRRLAPRYHQTLSRFCFVISVFVAKTWDFFCFFFLLRSSDKIEIIVPIWRTNCAAPAGNYIYPMLQWRNPNQTNDLTTRFSPTHAEIKTMGDATWTCCRNCRPQSLSLSLSLCLRENESDRQLFLSLKTPKIKLNLPPVGSAGSTGSRRRRVHAQFLFEKK